MTRSAKAAADAHAAADALSAWLETERARPRPTAPLEDGRPEGWVEMDVDADPVPNSTAIDELDRDQNGAATTAGRPSVNLGQTFRLPNPDWLHHRLTISGSPADLARFQDAAAGAGLIPWHYDLDRMEADFFHLLVAPQPRELSLKGARIFARQLRDAVGRRHGLAVSRVGQSRACPLDLHALVPVPAEILVLGPDEPEALAWLWEHWGTTQALRHVAIEAGRDPASSGETPNDALRLSFWSADWTPWRVFQKIAACWRTLHFQVRPTYDLK